MIPAAPATPRRTPAAILAALALPLALLPCAPCAAKDEPEPLPAPELARALAPAFAHAAISLRFDEGEPPANMARTYGDVVTEERTLDVAALLLAPDRVLVPDLELHPRFIASIRVSYGKQTVAAKPFAWLEAADGMILALDAPLEGAKPPAFDPAAKGPYRSVFHGKDEGRWRTVVGAGDGRYLLDEDGRATLGAWRFALVVDRRGTPVGVTLADEVPDDASWKGSPLSWPLVPAEQRDREVALVEARANAALLRVHLRLRSPKSGEGGGGPFRFGRDDGEASTERDVVGVLVAPDLVLVLASLDADTTARLESITAHPARGEAVPAEFVSTYRHYGALLARLKSPLPDPAPPSVNPLPPMRDRFLIVARLLLRGEQRSLHACQCRLKAFQESWRGQRVPELDDDAANHFLFDRSGALLAVPITRRAAGERPRWRGPDIVVLPGEYLAPLIADPAANADPAIVPVVAEREGRLAWLGVETQRLDRDLARANGVSHLTQDGRTGALVSYVYPGSPAERAKVEPGAVLLRLHVPDRPKPVDVGGSDEGYNPFGDMPDMPEEMMEQFAEMSGAHPWPSPETALNRTLTEVGIGKPFVLEYFAGGEVRKVDMVVEEGPVHFDAAPLFKSEAIGATVRDLTFEVRRYYQIDDKAQGVIVSKVERGKRAAVAGLRRLDIVLKVNDVPVPDAAAFGKAVESEGELRLAVKDRLKERIVQIAPVRK